MEFKIISETAEDIEKKKKIEELKALLIPGVVGGEPLTLEKRMELAEKMINEVLFVLITGGLM